MLMCCFHFIAVTIGFVEEEIFVDEGQGSVRVFVELTDVDIPTQTQIWADIISENSSALGMLNYSISIYKDN